ncbi:CMRF35-like molecule 4 [Myotis brandtii]|uniref:CMRF35-like molecule 4 n=1 Tax=Myotis brandtii TaxID=109478 RepID=S7NQA6_MYOBR|nr:CMRF35-like molecule 4 [Myotis brandtii]
MSIRDDHWRHRFTVTIEELRASDEDVYWCGIEKSGTDLGHQVRVYVGPGRTCPSCPQSLGPTMEQAECSLCLH